MTAKSVDWSELTHRTADRLGQRTFKRPTAKEAEKGARAWAGGTSSDLVEWKDIEWVPPQRPRIVYPEGKNRPTKIPLEANWYSPRRECHPVCRHTPDQCPTKPQYPTRTTWGQSWVRSPDPEGGDKLPESFMVREVNVMAFDDRPWLEGAPTELLAKIGYTQHDNNVKADKGGMAAAEVWHSGRLGVSNIKGVTVTRRAEWTAHRPGTWDEWDRDQRKAGPAKLSTADASQPPRADLTDSLLRLRGRECRNCLRRLDEDAHGRVRYCSERCRNAAENARRRGLVGTVGVGDELGYAAARAMTLVKWQAGVRRGLDEAA
ncbi:hypothetical protein [Mycobacterium marinum]|uniref:hypothetical protein n=1 Tax=Mycobacterium marinum TaxID=1781 RepID=UPI003564B371